MTPWHLYKRKKKFFDWTSTSQEGACLAIIGHWTKDYINNKPLIFHKTRSCNTVHIASRTCSQEISIKAKNNFYPDSHDSLIIPRLVEFYRTFDGIFYFLSYFLPIVYYTIEKKKEIQHETLLLRFSNIGKD